MKERYTQGICGDGAAILRDGEMISIDQVLTDLNQLADLSEYVDDLRAEVSRLKDTDLQVRRCEMLLDARNKLQEKNDALTVEREDLRSRVSRLEETCAGQQIRISDLSSYLSDAEKERDELRAEVEMLQQWKESARTDLNNIDRERLAERAERDQLRAELEKAQMDSARLETYLTGRCDNGCSPRDAILNLEMRCINGDYPSLDEWRAAIDKAILAAAPSSKEAK